MCVVRESEELKNLDNGNEFIGNLPELKNTTIKFQGKNNIFYCDQNVRLVNSTILFNGDDSIVFLCSNKHDYKLNVTVYNRSVFFMGKNNYINGAVNVILSERKHCIIGNDGLFSFGIWMRTADPHLLYDSVTKKRINFSKSIYIGDHVWVGQSAMILKGTQIDSGSIIGAMSVVSGKKINSNSTWAGNPVKKIKDNIFWDGACVHQWLQEQTDVSQQYEKYGKRKNIVLDAFIYKYDRAKSIEYEQLDKILDQTETDKKLEQLLLIKDNDEKNRFVHQVESYKKNSFLYKLKKLI